jgi:Leucine-rich repeat (LRR) protein
MSGLSLPLPPGRRRALAVETTLNDLDAELTRLREALPLTNDPALRPELDQLTSFARTADSVLRARGGAIDQGVVDAVADLLGTLRLVRLPARDPDLGFTTGLSAVRGAQGQIVLTLTNALAAAAALGLRPSQPEAADALAAELPRSLFDGKLAEITAQLDAVADRLEALDAARQAADATSPEAGLVEFYLGTMRVEVNLARLSLTLGEQTIDFAALARATGAMAELTGDFLATLRGWAARVSAAIRQAAERVGTPVRLMVTGLRAVAREAAGRVARGGDAPAVPDSPPPDPAPADPAVPAGFSKEAVRDLILAGKPIPAHWMPFVTALDFSGTNLADLSPLVGLTALRDLMLGESYSRSGNIAAAPVKNLTPLAGLSALQSLRLGGTQVRDLTPLAGLSALQSLDLSGTQVSDLTPIAGLSALQSLSLSETQVSDLTPIAGLSALQWLNLSETQVSDLTPIAGLSALQVLFLSRTQVSDLTPIAGLSVLHSLSLSGTQVSDLTPLAGLTVLQWLYLSGTPVSDLTPLAGLSALHWLDLSGTQVSDLMPLAGLSALRWLYLTGTQVSDLTTLASLTALRMLQVTGTPVRDVSALRHLKVKIEGGPPAPVGGRIGSAVRRLFRKGRDQR